MGVSLVLQLHHGGARAAEKIDKLERQQKIAHWASKGKHQYWGIKTVERLPGLTAHDESDLDDKDLGDGDLDKEELIDSGQGKRQICEIMTTPSGETDTVAETRPTGDPADPCGNTTKDPADPSGASGRPTTRRATTAEEPTDSTGMQSRPTVW